jgi:hypothetical protein
MPPRLGGIFHESVDRTMRNSQLSTGYGYFSDLLASRPGKIVKSSTGLCNDKAIDEKSQNKLIHRFMWPSITTTIFKVDSSNQKP